MKGGVNCLVKGKAVYNNRPIYWIPTDDMKIAPDEIFVDLTDFCIPGLHNYYQVSNYGRVYNKYTNKMMHLQIGTDGYFQVSLSGSFGSRLLRVNRLVMMAFYPIPNHDIMVVNHLDGNPKNNHISNLEWATRSRNTKHAYDIGLMKKGEEGYTSIISNETAHKICKCLETNMTFQDIVNTVGGNCTVNIVQSILHGGSWTDVSSQYDFSKRKVRRQKQFNDQEVNLICQYFENNPTNKSPYYQGRTKYFYDMLESFNFFDRQDKIEGMINTCDDIFKGVSYTKISRKYNF
jgi:hypothetical protein